jgi:hypothetical protein
LLRDIEVVQNDSRDWLVRETGGHDLGHCPTRNEAELVDAALARKRKSDLAVRAKTGREQRRKPRHGLWGRLFGRG